MIPFGQGGSLPLTSDEARCLRFSLSTYLKQQRNWVLTTDAWMSAEAEIEAELAAQLLAKLGWSEATIAAIGRGVQP